MSFAKAVAGAAFHEAYWDCDENRPARWKACFGIENVFFF